jgi:hypothetical protein
MRVFLKFDGTPQLELHYEDGEWEYLERLYREYLKLEQAETVSAWGCGKHAKFYRETNAELFRYWMQVWSDTECTPYYFDSINRPVWSERRLNLAIFRVIPDEKRRVRVPLDKFMNVEELNRLTSLIADFLRITTNLVMEAEVKIVWKKPTP